MKNERVFKGFSALPFDGNTVTGESGPVPSASQPRLTPEGVQDSDVQQEGSADRRLPQPERTGTARRRLERQRSALGVRQRAQRQLPLTVASAAATKRTVLLVTNDLLTRETLRHSLQRAGYKVVPAVNHREAREQCVRIHLDLLVVELDWPTDDGGDSRDVVMQVTSICPRVPIIVISVRADLAAEMESLGVAAVAEKPVDVPALLRTADELMAEPVRATAIGPSSHGFRWLPANGEAFREALLQRARAQFANQPGNRGLKE